MNAAETLRYMDDVIYDIFALKNKEEYDRRCSQPNLLLPSAITDFCKENGIEYEAWEPQSILIVDDEDEETPSSADWSFTFSMPEFSSKVYSMKSETFLCVSKLAKIYFLHNSFVCNDPDPDAVYPVNEGDESSGLPITKLEAALWSLLRDWLEGLGYVLLENRLANKKAIGLVDLFRVDANSNNSLAMKQTNEYDYLLDYFEIFFRREFEEIGVSNNYFVKRKYETSLRRDLS